MTRTFLSVGAIVIFASLPALSVLAATQGINGESFLKTAAQEQQAEIALGRLVTEKSSDPEVKQFGAKMVEDHQQANLEVQRLAIKEGVQLPRRMSEQQKHIQQELSQLSGREFDLAYMQYVLNDHKKDVNELEQSAQQLPDRAIKQWASSALPVLKQHLQRARTIASSMGLEAAQEATQ